MLLTSKATGKKYLMEASLQVVSWAGGAELWDLLELNCLLNLCLLLVPLSDKVTKKYEVIPLKASTWDGMCRS
jgi:hypothetical protein